MKNIYEQNGFSMIELLLVITMIGIISAIGMPSFQKARVKAEDTAISATLRTITTMQADYYSRNGRFARLTELNTMNGNALGDNGTNVVYRGKAKMELTPNPAPTDADLKNSYAVKATRAATSTETLLIMQLDQSGVISQITP